MARKCPACRRRDAEPGKVLCAKCQTGADRDWANPKTRKTLKRMMAKLAI